MAFYRLRKWITHHKWQENTHKCIQGSLSGTERCDSCRLSSYRYSLSLVYDLRSPSLSWLSTLSHTLAHREWVTWNMRSHRRHCFLQPDGQYAVLDHNQPFCSLLSAVSQIMGTFKKKEKKNYQKLIGDYLLLQCWALLKVHVHSSQINQFRSDAVLCLFHSVTPAIIFSLKKVTS